MSDKLKIFFVSQVFYPDEPATASLFTDLMVEIAKTSEIEVEVWCAQPSYTTRVRQKKKVVYNGISISYMAGTNRCNRNLVGRLLNYITFSISLFFSLIFSKDKTPIFTVTNPPFLGILISLIASIKKRPYTYIILDVHPEGLSRAGMIKENSLLIKVWKILNKSVLKRAEKILVLGRDMMSQVRQAEPSAVKKTIYVPHWQNENLIFPCEFESNDFVKEHNLSNHFVVQYSGNMGLWNDMRILAKAAKAFENDGVTFCFIGDGMRRKELLETWDNIIPSNTRLLPFQPKQTIGKSLTACHVALISLAQGLEGIAVPCKIYGILAAGTAVIAQVPEKSEIALAVREDQCGIVVKPNDLDGLINAIKYLRDHQSERLKMAANARQAFEEKYTTKKIAERYVKIAEAATKSTSRKNSGVLQIIK